MPMQASRKAWLGHEDLPFTNEKIEYAVKKRKILDTSIQHELAALSPNYILGTI